MQYWLLEHYSWVKAAHVIAMVAWMAGMFYLPRLFVYHVNAAKGSELSETLKIMERRLLRAIVNPAMILTFVFGGLLVYAVPDVMREGWIHVKLMFVFFLTFLHGFLSRARRQFAEDRNTHSQRFYRIINEVPTICLVVIVIMVVVRPF